jgi:hypothetical protein
MPALALLSLAPCPAAAQTLDPALIEAVHEGPARSELRSDTVTVPLVGRPTLPLLEARINGTGPWKLLVDLGSNVVILRRSVADSAGVSILVERDRSDIIRMDSIVVGGAVFLDVTGGAYDTLDVDGVLGFNLLDAFPFAMDYPAMQFTFLREAVPDPTDPDMVPYLLVDRMPSVGVRVGKDSLLLNLDTGAAEQMTVPEAWATRLPFGEPLSEGPSVHNNQTGTTLVRTGTLAEPIRLGTHRIEDVTVYVSSSAEGGWLGSALLQRFVLAFYPGPALVKVNGTGSRNGRTGSGQGTDPRDHEVPR